MNNSKIEIGENIKKNRVIRGITQHELAEKVGLTEKQISKIETGIHYPKFENFVKILGALNITMKEFDMENVSEQSSTLKSILKIIYSANEEELKYYLSLFKTIQKIRNKKQK